MTLDLPVTGELNWGAKINNALVQLNDNITSLNVAISTLISAVNDLKNQQSTAGPAVWG